MRPPTAAPSRPAPMVTPVQSRGPCSEFPHAARATKTAAVPSPMPTTAVPTQR